MAQYGSLEAVVVAVQEDAHAEIERIDRELDVAIARARAEDAAQPAVIADAEARIAAARHRVRDRTGAEDRADHEEALTAREDWMRRVREAGERRLAGMDAERRRADVIAFAVEAAGFMPDEPLEVLIPADASDVAEDVRREMGRAPRAPTIAAVRPSGDVKSGCVVQTADGRIRYENTYETRAERLEPIWRAFLAEQYERATQPVVAGAASRGAA